MGSHQCILEIDPGTGEDSVLSVNTETEAASHGHINLANEKTSEFCSKKQFVGRTGIGSSWVSRDILWRREKGQIPAGHRLSDRCL